MFSLQTKRAIYLMKTPFQLNCKLHMGLVRSRNIFTSRNAFGNLAFLYFALKENFFTLFGDHIFLYRVPVDTCIKALILGP